MAAGILRAVAFDLEAELRKMAEDPDLPAHLKLGVLKQLAALTGGGEPERGNKPVLAERADGLPPDPLLERFPEVLTDDEGRPNPADPMADLSWAGVVGRMPHALYARVLHTCPWHPTDLRYRSAKDMHRGEEARTLRDAEERSLREARNRGFDTEADEVAEKRRRRSHRAD